MNCSKCQYDNRHSATYCSKCGHKVTIENFPDYNIPVRNISYFFFALLAYILILHFLDFYDDYISLFIADSLFAIIVLIFFGLTYKTSIRLFNFRRFNSGLVIKIILIAIILAIIVHYLAQFLNQNVFNKSDAIYFNQFKDSPAPLLFSIISISVFPAIFEEMAFRGILFDEAYKITGLKPTILITSILFTLMHLSLLSSLWLFPLALFFGYLRAKYNTLFYGMIGHFVYNSSIVLIQMVA